MIDTAIGTAAIVDTSALLAYVNAAEPRHRDVAAVIDAARGPLVVSPYVVAELDYLVATRVGVREEISVLRQLASGAWDLACLDAAELADVVEVVASYPDQRIGVTDASLIVLAARHRTSTVITLDRRHVDVLRPIGGGTLTVMP